MFARQFTETFKVNKKRKIKKMRFVVIIVLFAVIANIDSAPSHDGKVSGQDSKNPVANTDQSSSTQRTDQASHQPPTSANQRPGLMSLTIPQSNRSAPISPSNSPGQSTGSGSFFEKDSNSQNSTPRSASPAAAHPRDRVLLYQQMANNNEFHYNQDEIQPLIRTNSMTPSPSVASATSKYSQGTIGTPREPHSFN